MKRQMLSLFLVLLILISAGGAVSMVGAASHVTPGQITAKNTASILGHNNVIVGSRDTYVADEALVRFKPEARTEGGVVQEITADAHAKLGAAVKEEFRGVPGLQLVKLPKRVSVPDAVAQYKQNPDVLYAEPNYLQYADAIPNNPDFKYQWGLYNTGQTIREVTGTPGADIDAPKAWDKTTGSKDFIVATIDSGVDYRAPDLAPNIVNGWDFITNSSDPMDRTGHGTHVAGIIAAAGNSGIGVTGVMWKAKIMPLRAMDSTGYGKISDIINAIDYANSHGASIINMSFGNYLYSQAQKDAIDASPALFICAAGNDGSNNDQEPFYPSSYSSGNIISVAATDQNDVIAPSSNYGPKSVQVAAPGRNILSTYPPYIPLFNDQFNDFAAWDAQAGWHIPNDRYVSPPNIAMVSSPSGSVVNASMTLKNPLDLTSKCGTALVFDMKLDTVKDHSLFYVKASRDSVNWDRIDSWSGDSRQWMYEQRCSLANYDTSPYLYIRFGLITDGSAGPNSVYLANVNILAFDPSSTKENYRFVGGTSMAVPYVSGLAGLVKALHPDYSSLQIKDAILKNVDVKRSLSGKILTWGRINAGKTLSGG